MHKRHGDHGRGNKFFAHADIDGDWGESRHKRGRSKTRRIRYRPYEKYYRGNRADWFEDIDDEYY
jgi:hypothetical protein